MTTLQQITPIQSLAKAIFAFVIVLTVFTSCKKELNSDQVFKDHFEVQEMVLEERPITDDAPDTKFFNIAIAQYKSKDYIAAAKTYTDLAAMEPRSGAYPFFAAAAYMAAEKYAEAIPFYQKVIERPRANRSSQQARWNMALAMIKTNDLAGAKEQLKEIKEGEFKFEEAKALLEKF